MRRAVHQLASLLFWERNTRRCAHRGHTFDTSTEPATCRCGALQWR
jgi:hypothetical protein